VSGEEVARIKRELELPSVDTLAGDTLKKVRASLGTDLIVLGSYTALGPAGEGRLRVDFRVQNTATGETMAAWSHTGSEAELLELITESGLAARDRLGLDTSFAAVGKAATERALASGLPSSAEARRLYAEALDALRGFDAGRARERFEQTIRLDPDFAMAHVGLAMSWSVLGYDARAVEEASRAAGLARGLRNEQKLWIEGLQSEYTRDWPKAIAAYRRLVDEYSDEPDYVIRLVEAQTSGGVPKDALASLAAARKSLPGSADDPRLLLAEASAADALGDATGQEKAARLAIARAEQRGERLLVARASISLGRALQLLGNLEGALAANQSSLDLYEAAGDRRGVARARIQLGDLARERGDLAGAERHLTTALDISRSIGSRRQITQSLNTLASVYFDSGRFAPAATMYEEAIRVSREVGDRNAQALALGNLASVRYEQGSVSDSLGLDQQALTIRREIGDRRSVAFSLTNMAETAADLGRLDQARRMYEESRQINAALSDKVELSYSLSGLAMLAVHRDDLQEAQRLLEQAIQLRMEAGDPDGVVEEKLSLSHVHLERRELTQAAGTLMAVQEGLEGAGPETVVQAAVVRSALLLAQKRVADARLALAPAVARGKAGLGLASGVRLDLMEARVQAAEGKADAAVARARTVRDRMRDRQLSAFELEAELVILQAKPNRSAAEELAKRAGDAGFLLIARKAQG
jgi:tetratricopeptide (TPR) repeat protein